MTSPGVGRALRVHPCLGRRAPARRTAAPLFGRTPKPTRTIANPTARERNDEKSLRTHEPKAGAWIFFFATSERPSRLTPEEPRFFPQVYDARRAAESRVGQLSVAARERARRVSQPPKRTARRCKRICLCEKSKARYVTTYPVVSPRPATRTYPFLFRRSRKRSGFSVQRARLGEGAHRV